MMTSAETIQSINPLDAKMTPAQVARRKFKSSLPRKIQSRPLSAMEALGEVFTLFDRLRGAVVEQGLDESTVQAALAYYQPESDPPVFVAAIPLPGPSGIGRFADRVVALDRPVFLGALFQQEDPDTKNPAYKRVIFVAQFMGGPEAEGRLLAARKRQQFGTD